MYILIPTISHNFLNNYIFISNILKYVTCTLPSTSGSIGQSMLAVYATHTSQLCAEFKVEFSEGISVYVVGHHT